MRGHCVCTLVVAALAVHHDHVAPPTIEFFDHYDKNMDSLLDKEEFFRAIIEHSSRKHDYHESAATSRLDEELDRYWKNDYQRCILPSALIFRPMPGKDGTPGRHHFLDATTLKPQEEWVINDAQAHQITGISSADGDDYMIEGHYERTDPRLLGKISITKITALPEPKDTSAYRFYRFTVTKQKNDASEAVQVSNFRFWSGPLCQDQQIPIAVTNPYGNSGTRTFEDEKFAGYHEGPSNLVDEKPLTKWLDFNKEPVVFEFAEGTPALTCYSWATANDMEERDPTHWQLEGSPTMRVYGDGHYDSDFDIVDERPISTDAPVTFHRNTFLAKMPFTTSYTTENYDGRFVSQSTFEVNGEPLLIEQEYPGDLQLGIESGQYTNEVSNSSHQYILINGRMVFNASEADWGPCLSSVFTTSEVHTIVKGDPLFATTDFANTEQINGNVVFVERGENVSFFDKAHRAQQAGATAVLIGNVEPSDDMPCPLLSMEVEPGFRVDIPVVLLTFEESRSIATQESSTFSLPSVQDQWYPFSSEEYIPEDTLVRTIDGKERGVITGELVDWSFGKGYVVKMYKDGTELLFSNEYAGIVGNLRNVLTQDLERKIPDATLMPRLGERNKLDFLNFSHSTYHNTHNAELTTHNFDRSVGMEVLFEATDLNADGKVSKEEACTVLHADT